jgi:hypothetical protein
MKTIPMVNSDQNSIYYLLSGSKTNRNLWAVYMVAVVSELGNNLPYAFKGNWKGF